MSGQEPRMGPDLGPNVPPSAGRIDTAVGGETVLMTIKNCSNFVQSEEVVISRWLGTSDPVCPRPLHGPPWSWTPPWPTMVLDPTLSWKDQGASSIPSITSQDLTLSFAIEAGNFGE